MQSTSSERHRALFTQTISKKLADLSTLGIGGSPKYFVTVKTIAMAKELLIYLSREKIPFWILGKGSNTLFDDRGFDGVVILNRIDFLHADEHYFSVGGGYSFSRLGVQTAKQGFSGLEFAGGIPGSVGGAVYMNAGANGQETCEVLKEVSYLNRDGKLRRETMDPKRFGYRTSPFQGTNALIVGALFALKKDPLARKRQLHFLEKRLTTQPYREKSAGSIFRNPPLMSAGKLIEQAGLKGKTIGRASISMQHANFIVNKGGATAREVMELIELVQREVKRQFGVELELELKNPGF